MMISPKAVDVAENEDGTKTWRLTVSLGTVGDRTFKAVSYTHLDVYKRQLPSLPLSYHTSRLHNGDWIS